MVLGPPPPVVFVEQLRERQIDIALGLSIEANAPDAHAVLTLVREMELPLVLLFNRERDRLFQAMARYHGHWHHVESVVATGLASRAMAKKDSREVSTQPVTAMRCPSR